MRLVQDLEEMNLLIRKPRFDEETGAQITTIFDFRPLVQRLIEEMRKTQLEHTKETQTPEPVTRAGGGDKFVRGGVTNLSGGGVTNLSPKEDTYNNKTQLKNTHHNKVRNSKPSQQETSLNKAKNLRERVHKYFKNGIFRKRLFEVYDNLYEIKPFNELVEEGAYRACKEILVNRAQEIDKSRVKLDPNKIATEIKSIFPYEALPREHGKARSFFVTTICNLTAEKIVSLLSPNN